MKHKRSLMSIAVATIMLVSLCAVCASTSVSARIEPRLWDTSGFNIAGAACRA